MTREEMISTTLYSQYGIAEWHEKCQILSVAEKIEILENLLTGSSSHTVEIVKLPFPEFVEVYFRDFSASSKYFEDPTFAYKLFFLRDYDLRYFAEKMRTPQKKREEILEEFAIPAAKNFFKNFQELLETPYENLPRIMSMVKRNREFEIKYAYLSQYIDTAEAKRLGLGIYDTFVRDGIHEGFNLHGKIALLNPTMKMIFVHYLGLYGHLRKSKAEIERLMNLKKDPDDIVDIGYHSKVYKHDLIELFFSYFSKTLGEFKNYLGFSESRQTPGNIFEYGNKPVNELSIKMETNYILYNLPPEAKKVLQNLKQKQIIQYIVAKYLFKTKEALARTMVLTPQDAQRLLDRVSQKGETL